uniref:ARAD1C09218p n=1 Tax=Blastobotrys adeninivorans TaxID=409370 RepID=A0A060T019_BLAAD
MTSQVNDPSQAPNPQTQAQAQAQVVQQQQDVSEVGWMFIQQYYTFVNNKPHQLHLFYTTSSTLCHGVEGQAVPSYRGQTQIQQRMREHGFQDCKVMVSNVDVQGSADGGVVVQVLGEMANAGRPSQKFCQTFFLAPQPRGYYVLNDILRFLKEDVDVEDDSGASATTAPNATVSNDSLFAQKLGTDEQLNGGHHSDESNGSNGSNGTVGAQEKVVSPPAPAPAPTQVQAQQPQASAQAQPSAPEVQSKAAVEKSQSPAATAEQKPSQPKAQPEKESKPVAKQPAKTAAAPKEEQKAPAQPAKPSAPLTWADKIKPASAPGTTSTTAGAGTSSAATTAEPNGSATRSATAPAPASTTAQGSAAASGKRSSQSGQRQRPEFHSAYIKHVTQKVDDGLLKQALERIGKLTHFQVEKSKSCAFVDFIDEATLKNALAVHELKVGDQTVLIEERKRGGAKKNSGSNSKNRNSNSKRKA